MPRHLLPILLTAALAAACAGMRPTLGPPTPQSVVVVGPTDGKYDYFVHMSGDPAMADRQTRLNRARQLIAARCVVAEVVDLYAHVTGARADGTPLVSYSVAVVCEGEKR
ncbi:MAG: hypothetical protein HZA24_11710 [Nitrospirae bacterium]|nr:hypothetical protein [Nitrospirota bacterium]